MADELSVILSDLDKGSNIQIQVSVPGDFLQVEEEALSFPHPVKISGEAYLVQKDVILRLGAETRAQILCKICNSPTDFAVHAEQNYYSVPRDSIKDGKVDFSELLREAILVEIPGFAECNGNCPQRDAIQSFLKQGSDVTGKEEGYQPFADLDFDQVLE